MQYLTYEPHILLRPYIEAYWVLQTGAGALSVPLFADASTDIFINLGMTNADLGLHMPVAPGRMYMGGPATSVHFFNCFPGNVFVGIRFKPGGLPLFYHASLAMMVDQVTTFEDKQLALILDMDAGLPSRLDTYFLSRKTAGYTGRGIIEAVYHYKGQISVDQLGRKCHISNRTLERYFFHQVGIGPKEFINIVRFREVMRALEMQQGRVEFSRLAVEMGYYDQSHLNKEFKRRSGSSLSALGPVTRYF